MILPRHLVQVINHWYHGTELEEETLAGAWEEFAGWERWLEAESGFWVIEEERAELEAVEKGLAALATALGQGQWRPAFELLRQLEGWMAAINERRARAPYSPLPALHHCILAGGAVIIGQGRWQCLEPRWVLVEAFLDNLEAAFRGELDSLPEEVSAALWVGFERAQQAVDLGRKASEPEGLREALKQLQEAGELLVFLPRRQQKLAEELEAAARLKIPVVGGRLESDLSAPAEEWPARARLRLEVTLPVLERLVFEEGRGVLLPPGQEGLWDPLDLALAQLRKFYETRPSNQGLAEALERLSGAFVVVDSVRVRAEALSSELAARCVHLCRSVLRGELPDPAVAELLEELAPLAAWAGVAQALSDYLSDGESEALQRAAWGAPAASEKLSSGGSGLSFVAE